jgi:hypothetical protein
MMNDVDVTRTELNLRDCELAALRQLIFGYCHALRSVYFAC